MSQKQNKTKSKRKNKTQTPEERGKTCGYPIVHSPPPFHIKGPWRHLPGQRSQELSLEVAPGIPAAFQASSQLPGLTALGALFLTNQQHCPTHLLACVDLLSHSPPPPPSPLPTSTLLPQDPRHNQVEVPDLEVDSGIYSNSNL